TFCHTHPATPAISPLPLPDALPIFTVKPAPVPGRGNALQAPHINVALFARGLLRPLYPRLYFADEAANAADPLLSSIDDRAARRSEEHTSELQSRFDLVCRLLLEKK